MAETDIFGKDNKVSIFDENYPILQEMRSILKDASNRSLDSYESSFSFYEKTAGYNGPMPTENLEKKIKELGQIPKAVFISPLRKLEMSPCLPQEVILFIYSFFDKTKRAVYFENGTKVIIFGQTPCETELFNGEQKKKAANLRAKGLYLLPYIVEIDKTESIKPMEPKPQPRKRDIGSPSKMEILHNGDFTSIKDK